MNARACALSGPNDERIALCNVSVDAHLRDLLAEVEIAQTYRNDEPVNIEATYTFPLPVDAVLLGLTITLGDRVLSGVVVEKHEAEDTYEDALEAGNTAVMLQAIEPGLYTLNLGNLMPGECATLRLRYTQLHRWTGNSLRFHLPTTIAPRYGESPHLPHQAPEASLSVENMFTLQVTLEGCLLDARIECPTHPVTLAREHDRVCIGLQQARAPMDRDFVLNLHAPAASHGVVMTGTDGDGMAAIASFQPFFPGLRTAQPLKVAVLIDCSGSMAGASIVQARSAVARILEGLRPSDHATLIAFGNTTQTLSDRLLACDTRMLARARAFAEALDANLGGTEIEQALRVAYRSLADHAAGDVFLITDGEVSEWQSVVEEARASGCRVFTVGVGSAVSEAFVRQLAGDTGGGCELVTPGEAMPERIVRHFERMRAPRARRARVRWPDGAVDCSPTALGSVFEGDTIVASARFERLPAEPAVVLEIETEDGQRNAQPLRLAAPATAATAQPSTVARLAAAMRLREQPTKAATATALHYDLISEHTHMLVVAERSEAERASQLPELRKVPQTMAADTLGIGMPTVFRRLASTASAGSASDPAFQAAIARLISQRPDTPPSINRLIESIAQRLRTPDFDHIDDLLSGAGGADVASESGIDIEAVLQHARQCRVGARAAAAMILSALVSGPLEGRLVYCDHDALRQLIRFAQAEEAWLRTSPDREVIDCIDHVKAASDALCAWVVRWRKKRRKRA